MSAPFEDGFCRQVTLPRSRRTIWIASMDGLRRPGAVTRLYVLLDNFLEVAGNILAS